jgi:Ca2+-binding RTX toxin-like protein
MPFPIASQVGSVQVEAAMATIIGHWFFGDFLWGTVENDFINGRGGDDEIFAWDGDDVVYGEGGDDWLHGEDGNDTLWGGDGSDILDGGDGDDALYGGSNIGLPLIFEHLHGGAGNDWLVGGPGADWLFGGPDNDTYVVDDYEDLIVENEGEGHDTVRSSVSIALASNFEDLILTGSAINGDGNELNNRIVGNGVGNSLQGQAGNDELDGGSGNDSLHGGNDHDLLKGGPGDDWLQGGDGNDILLGGEDNDTLSGGAGEDVLDGGAGYDYMDGGLGDDNYKIDNGGDWMFEMPGEGIDTVQSPISYALPRQAESEVDNLVLLGTAVSGDGNELKNTLVGNDAANFLNGHGDDDRLIGGLGQDTMTGGAGIDWFTFHAANESAFGAADVIVDFLSHRFVPMGQLGEKIDLGSIDADINTAGDQAFRWIGNNNGFVQAWGAGQLRCNNGFVEGDVDGDFTTIELSIRVFQTDNLLVAADFNL